MVNDKHSMEIVKKSNKFIQALGSPSLLSEKILLMSLLKVEERTGENLSEKDRQRYDRISIATGTDFSKGLVAEISNQELRYLSQNKSGSFYDSVRALLNPSKTNPKTLRNNLVFLAPDDSGILGYTELITGSAYENGIMYIKFNPEDNIRKEILDLKDNYSLLSAPLFLQWKSVFSYRIYELILAQVGHENAIRKKYNKGPKDKYEYTFEFGELKFLLGILDPTSDAYIQNKLSSKEKVDYNSIAEEMTKNTGQGKTCAKYSDLSRYALAKAEKEINECNHPDCDYNVHFEPDRQGKGGKVVSIKMIVTKKGTEEIIEEKVMNDDDILDFVDAIRKMIPYNITTKELKKIAEAAEYDMTKIEKAVKVATSTKNIKSVVGFLIKAIVEDWDVKEIKSQATKMDNSNTYDYDDLEKKLLEYKGP